MHPSFMEQQHQVPRPLQQSSFSHTHLNIVAEDRDDLLVLLREQLMRGFHLQRAPLLLQKAFCEDDDELVAGLHLPYQIVGNGVEPVRVPRTVDMEKAEVEVFLLEGPKKKTGLRSTWRHSWQWKG